MKIETVLTQKGFLSERLMHSFEGYASAHKRVSQQREIHALQAPKQCGSKESKSIKERFSMIVCNTLSSITSKMTSQPLVGQYQFTQIDHKTSFNSQKYPGFTINYVVL